MPTVSVEVERDGNLGDLLQKIIFGAATGLDLGGMAMETVVKSTVGDMARYPTGELAGSVKYEPLTDGVISSGQVIAGTDHVNEFEDGTFPHFVPYEEADERIKAGMYPHIKPVYASLASGSGASGAYGGNAAKGAGSGSNESRTPIGYIAYGDEHPFMEVGFGASYMTVVQEVINQIQAATGG